ncbi:hypothetical protein Tco_1193602 [Tanacetum coccineum]
MHTRASNYELVEPLLEPERTLNRRRRRRNRRVPFDQRNNPPKNPRIVYLPILDINHFRHFLVTLENLYPIDDEPMWAADRIVALTLGSAITIPETANKFAIKALFDRLLEEIQAFSQHENESLTDAWLRMKEMLRNCHGHNLSKGNIIKIFYHGLSKITQEVLNAAAGEIMARMDAMTLKMDAQYKELQTHAKKIKPDLDEDDIPMSREEEAKFMQTFDHLAKFHKMTNAKEMWDAIKSRFGRNDESKKMKKYILKQQFEGFTVSNTEGLHKGYDRFQSLLSQLEIHREDKQLANVPVPLDHFPVNTLTSKVFSFMVKKGKHFSGKVTPLFAAMLVQPTEDEGAPSERPSEAQPTPSLAPTSEVPIEPQTDSSPAHEVPFEPHTDSSPAHTSEVPIEQQNDPSPRPSPSTIIPDSIPEASGGNIGGHSSSDKSLSGNDGELTLQKIKSSRSKLNLLANITEHGCKVSPRAKIGKKRSSKKQWVHKESVSKQGRKFAKGESLVQGNPLFDEIPEDTVDHMETENAQDKGRTREIVDEDKELRENLLILEGCTDEQIESTDKQRKGTEDHTGEGNATQATQTPTSTIFGDDETIAKLKKFKQLESDEEMARKYKKSGKIKRKKIKRSDEDFISIGSAEDERLIKRMNEKGVDFSKDEMIKEESKEEVKKESKAEVQEESKEEESKKKRKLGTRKKMKSRKRRYIQNTSEDDCDKENDELRLHLTIAPDEEKEVDYEILDRKYPIKEWKTECLGTKPQTDQAEDFEEINQNVVIRSNGQKRYFSTLMRVLSIFDREDLNAVYQLVMDRFQDEIPEGFDRVLWGDLMVMFNPDDENEFWNSQLDWTIVSWKLHSSSGVHTLVTETGLIIHMLVEKKYPLRKEVLMQMLESKLESEEDNTMALELIRSIKKLLTELESEDSDGIEKGLSVG